MYVHSSKSYNFDHHDQLNQYLHTYYCEVYNMIIEPIKLLKSPITYAMKKWFKFLLLYPNNNSITSYTAKPTAVLSSWLYNYVLNCQTCA